MDPVLIIGGDEAEFLLAQIPGHPARLRGGAADDFPDAREEVPGRFKSEPVRIVPEVFDQNADDTPVTAKPGKAFLHRAEEVRPRRETRDLFPGRKPPEFFFCHGYTLLF